MRKQDFHYELPEALIAQYPLETRSSSRLLHLTRAATQPGSASINHLKFENLVELVRPGDLLVFNDTRVIPARLFGTKSTGGQVEILVERLVDEYRCLAHLKASHSPKDNSIIKLHESPSNFEIKVESRPGDLYLLASASGIKIAHILEQAGHMPLPPYIKRTDTSDDFERYQTIYSRRPGAVAAPTAGLHFDESLISKLRENNVQSTYITLHVGAGTFQPVRTENIEDHQMHNEYIEVSQKTVEHCHKIREQGGRIIAVGTTSVRALETASRSGQLEPFCGETDIFIYPGYQFRSVDAMITNFHLPESTLLMLVCAFSDKQTVMSAYQAAVEQNYRFFSYGDAMFID